MRLISPLKPLIAAMFVLVAATASAVVPEQTTETATSVGSGSYANFYQSFVVNTDSVLNSWTFFGSQSSKETLFSFDVSNTDGSVLDGIEFDQSYSAAAGGWSFTFTDGLTLRSGVYVTTLSFAVITER